jgi:DNA-binding winged helix-turn-helix (wHTH) protein/TolB-like protein
MLSGRFRFGLFEFNAATRELRREGVLVRLQSQPAQLLACLIERAGQTVSREELRKALWGDATFVDFDRGLNFCISQIRSALKDDSAEPTYIRTLPKQGYQFIAPVERIAEPAPEAAAPASMTGEPARGRSYRRMLELTGTAMVVAVLILAAGYRLRSRSAAKPAPIVAVLRFDNETGDPEMTRFSDALTDTVVERLTAMSQGRYQIIGNAQVLRQPREQRDLNAIGTELHAAYVVLGQVQRNNVQRNNVQQSNAQQTSAQRSNAQPNSAQRDNDLLNPGQIRILAHLIRLPAQTHLWVVRTDRALADPLGIESEVAEKIGSEFSSRVVADSAGKRTLPPLANH